MNVFQLARLRHLDLLELFFRLNPDGHRRDDLRIARLPKDQLAKAVIASLKART